jgi:serine/threonine protein phosphatase PrpC
MLRDSLPEQRVTGAVLLGPDHTRLDESAVRSIGLRSAIGLSRGRFPKGYPQVDPNEDAAAAYTNGDRWLMAVADGHGGAAAAEAVVQAIASHARSLLAEQPERATRAAMVLAARAVLEVNAGLGGSQSSRTALTVASICGNVAHHTGAGDSAMYVVAGRRVRRVDTPAPFLGAGDETEPPVYRVPLRRVGAVILATDGLTDFLGHNWRHAIRAACAPSPDATAGALMEAAFTGGAGDNVAVAVWQRGHRPLRR